MRFQLQPDQVLVAVNNHNNNNNTHNNINQINHNINQQYLQSSDLTTLDRLDNELAHSLRFSNSATRAVANSNRTYGNDLLNSTTTLAVNDNRIGSQDSFNLGLFGDLLNHSRTTATNHQQAKNKLEENGNGNDYFDGYNRRDLIYNEVKFLLLLLLILNLISNPLWN